MMIQAADIENPAMVAPQLSDRYLLNKIGLS